MVTLQQKISQAKTKLLLEYPYFGTLASKIELLQNDDIEAFKSDGKSIEYRAEYLQELSVEELEFILANGAMHTSLAHQNRKNKRSGWLWQMATDLAINDMLVQNGLSLPQRAQYRKRFSGMYAEEIYAQLQDDILRADEDLEYEAQDADDVEPNDTPKDSQEQDLQEEILAEQLFAQEALSLLIKEVKNGDEPKSIERFFSFTPLGKIDWREELRSAINRYLQDQFVLIPPSKKLLYEGIYLPSSISETFRLVIAVDSSGSVDETLLNTFLGEVNLLMEVVQNYEIDLLVCDDKIQQHASFLSGETLACKIVGGGGTNFVPVFEYIQTELIDTQLLLYFTDLDGKFPKERPNYEVKWISSKEKEIPFGEILILQD